MKVSPDWNLDTVLYCSLAIRGSFSNYCRHTTVLYSPLLCIMRDTVGFCSSSLNYGTYSWFSHSCSLMDSSIGAARSSKDSANHDSWWAKEVRCAVVNIHNFQRHWCRVYITICSVRESICSAVPAIFMPFFAEQVSCVQGRRFPNHLMLSHFQQATFLIKGTQCVSRETCRLC